MLGFMVFSQLSMMGKGFEAPRKSTGNWDTFHQHQPLVLVPAPFFVLTVPCHYSFLDQLQRNLQQESRATLCRYFFLSCLVASGPFRKILSVGFSSSMWLIPSTLSAAAIMRASTSSWKNLRQALAAAVTSPLTFLLLTRFLSLYMVQQQRRCCISLNKQPKTQSSKFLHIIH